VTNNIPVQPPNSFRVTLTVSAKGVRLDAVLLEALRAQSDNLALQKISRTAFKNLFHEKAILIKGQVAKPSSALASGTTYIDILGFTKES
jgi:hypothetical protein